MAKLADDLAWMRRDNGKCFFFKIVFRGGGGSTVSSVGPPCPWRLRFPTCEQERTPFIRGLSRGLPGTCSLPAAQHQTQAVETGGCGLRGCAVSGGRGELVTAAPRPQPGCGNTEARGSAGVLTAPGSCPGRRTLQERRGSLLQGRKGPAGRLQGLGDLPQRNDPAAGWKVQEDASSPPG